ncbi:MMPL family transporter [Occultella glacieicola]|uniref:MMPL family transporter n=1 Tax=Occultella glacieicola TaxID=2518684 RepID=A0ABY2E1H6_9MICO|nr:MMPL family transporter [Occultella glacieicola]TDE92473.1 MMPL family transporter [Occultella glacieicola]
MAPVFDRLGRDIAHRPRLTVIIWILLVGGCLALAMTGFGGGPGLFDRLHSGEPRVPGSQSQIGADIIADNDDTGETISLVIQGVDLSDPDDVSAAGRASTTLHTTLLAIDGVDSVVDPYVFPGGPADPRALAFVSTEQDGFFVSVTLAADAPEAAHDEVVTELEEFPTAISGEATGLISSSPIITDEIIGQLQTDLARGEAVALPISLLIMIVVFGGFLTAGMPLAGALASIAGGLGALYGFSYVLDLDSVVVNVVTVLGLGLSIDYGLLIVSRYREEIRAAAAAEAELGAGERRSRGRRGRRGVDPVLVRALRRTMSTAGRTVTFSAVTVAVAISGLLLLRPDILKSLGAAGVSVVVIAVASALTLVPALLTLVGRRMLKPSVLSKVPVLRSLIGRLGDVAPEHGFFSRLAGGVQRRPWVVLVLTTIVLAVLASPVLGLQLRNSTTEMLPRDSDQRDFIDVVQADYPMLATPAVQVLVEAGAADAQTFADEISALPDVEGVNPPTAVGDSHQLIGVRPDTDDAGGEVATAVVEEIRELGRTDGAPEEVWVLGQAANQLDFTDALLEGLPWAVGVVIVATFVLLFLMTGSLLVPLKALLINILSLGASLGITTWVFQQGHLSGPLGFTSTGGLESYVVAIVIAFGFGLAMDYEVFLLARIKEFYDASGDNDLAVRQGLQQSGRIITSAALVIVVVFAGFATGELIAIKQAGVALALTVLVDATLVRMLLVPATMTLLGHWNWWAPEPLRRLHKRFAIQH